MFTLHYGMLNDKSNVELVLTMNEFILKMSHYDPEELSLEISESKLDVQNPYINIAVAISTVEEDVNTKYSVQINQLKSFKIVSDNASSIHLQDSHPLLDQFNQKQVSLYFKSRTHDPFKLFWDLSEVHSRLFQDLIPISCFLNSELSVYDLLRQQFGLLADGPLSIMSEYAKCLEQNGCSFSFANERDPMIWNGEAYTTGIICPQILFIGQSYIIAEAFEIFELTSKQ